MNPVSSLSLAVSAFSRNSLLINLHIAIWFKSDWYMLNIKGEHDYGALT